MDIRLQQLSYSSLLTLHQCPRKYQLYKLNADITEVDYESSVTFSLGHVVGAGIQDVLQGKSKAEIIWNAFLTWEADIFAEDTKRNKSFWEALIAIQRFEHLVTTDLLKDYELVYYTPSGSTVPVPAVELSFIIHLPNGYKYRGFVDAVLRNKETGEILVLELKTTAREVNPAVYKNSAQAIGYSVVLDVLFPELSSYKVLYLVYNTKERTYLPLPFTKSYLQRALWIQEILLDCEMITLYDNVGVFPMHGESCFNFYKECGYYNTCTLSTQFITKPITEEGEAKILEDHSNFHISLSVEDLINAQISKSTLTTKET